MSIPYNLAQAGETGALTVLVDGKVHSASHLHPQWEKLLTLIDPVTHSIDDAQATRLVQLLDPGVGVQDFFERVSERVTVANGQVHVDGDVLDDGLTQNILDYIEEGNDPTPYVEFLEKVLTNPNEHSREQLFDWLSRHDFAITETGNFLAYKGVYPRSEDSADLDRYPYQSSSRGTAVVDGQTYNGQIPNGVGAVVEMPRSEVAHDPAVGCHTGLHAGTWEYASTFTSGPTLLVEINPRDVVSVPTDCDWQKIRTCRYTVVEVIDQKLDTLYRGAAVEDDYDDEEDEYEDDGYCDCDSCQW